MLQREYKEFSYILQGFLVVSRLAAEWTVYALASWQEPGSGKPAQSWSRDHTISAVAARMVVPHPRSLQSVSHTKTMAPRLLWRGGMPVWKKQLNLWDGAEGQAKAIPHGVWVGEGVWGAVRESSGHTASPPLLLWESPLHSVTLQQAHPGTGARLPPAGCLKTNTIYFSQVKWNTNKNCSF